MDEQLLGFDQGTTWQSHIDTLLDLAGSNPFAAMWYLFANGGWIIFLWVFLWGAKSLYMDYIQGKNGAKKEWILLRVTVPRVSEQTPKAAENIFATFAGAHSPFTWTETYIQGAWQSPIAIEIASIEGQVGYYVHAERRLRDLVEAAIYAQYPDADIDEVEDYTNPVPKDFPDQEWDLWGCEMTPVKSDAYSLKTYLEFEDKISGEFKDPLAALLENFSRIGSGENVFYQIVLLPTDQKDFRGRAEEQMNKIKGIKKEAKSTWVDDVLSLPGFILSGVIEALGFGGGGEKKPEKKDGTPRILTLSPREKEVLEAMERKASKIGFLCKIRVIYAGKKEKMKKARVVQPFIGAIKQTNTFDAQALKPESKRVGVNSAFWFFKDWRNDRRKERLIRAYRDRSAGVGLSPFMLSAEELATLWHFPILTQVKAPQLRRTEAKKVEPPANIPFGG